MCLEIDDAIDASVRKSDFTDGKLIAYKVLEHGIDGTARSPFYGGIYTSGVVESSRSTTALSALELEAGSVDVGIHVFLDRVAAERSVKEHPDGVVVALECRLEHLVAAGDYDGERSAVFTQVTLPAEEHAKVLAAPMSWDEFDDDDDDWYDDDDMDDDY